MNRVAVALLAVSATLVFVETSSAQLFPRVWARRKAEIRAEVEGQLRWELGRKMDADLARQMVDAKTELNQDATAKIQAEAARLTEQVHLESVKMHQDAETFLTAEAKKLSEATVVQIQKMQEDAVAKIAAESKRLSEQIAAELGKLKTENEKLVTTEFAKLKDAQDKQVAAALKDADAKLQTAAGDAKKATDALQAGLTAELAKLPTQVTAAIEKHAAKLKEDMLPQLKEMVQSEVRLAQAALKASEVPPVNPPKEPPAEQPAAIPSKPVEPVEDKSGDEAP